MKTLTINEACFTVCPFAERPSLTSGDRADRNRCTSKYVEQGRAVLLDLFASDRCHLWAEAWGVLCVSVGSGPVAIVRPKNAKRLFGALEATQRITATADHGFADRVL